MQHDVLSDAGAATGGLHRDVALVQRVVRQQLHRGRGLGDGQGEVNRGSAPRRLVVSSRY